MESMRKHFVELFSGILNHSEIEWVLEKVGTNPEDIKKCDHCINIALGIGQKLTSPLGLQWVSNMENHIRSVAEKDRAQNEKDKEMALEKLESLLGKMDKALAMPGLSPGSIKNIEAQRENVYKIRCDVLANYEKAKRSIAELEASSKAHFGNMYALMSTLGGIGGLKN